MKLFHKIIFWIHLTAGVVAGLIILVMSVTGFLLAFEPQILKLAEREMRIVKPQASSSRLSPGTIFAGLKEQIPDAKPSGLTIASDPTAAVTIPLGREGIVYIDPYSGKVLGEGSKGWRIFFHVVEDYHRWLGVKDENRAFGKSITGVCNAAFLVLAISGIYLWWPKKWIRQYLIPIITFRPGLSGKARDFNWHNVIGSWCALVIILLTATGLVISYPWATNLLYTLTGNTPPPPQARPTPPPQESKTSKAPRSAKPSQSSNPIPGNIDLLWSRAEKQVPEWNSITLRLPSPGAPVTFAIEDGTSWNPVARSQLTLNAKTIEMVKWEPYSAANMGRKLRLWARSAHTGEAGRLPGQIIASLATLGGAFLVYTGLALAWRRFRAWLTKRFSKQLEQELVKSKLHFKSAG